MRKNEIRIADQFELKRTECSTSQNKSRLAPLKIRNIMLMMLKNNEDEMDIPNERNVNKRSASVYVLVTKLDINYE